MGDTLQHGVQTEVVLPVELILQSARVQAYDPIDNEVKRRVELGMVEEQQELAQV